MEGTASVIGYGLCAAVCLFLFRQTVSNKPKLDHIPVIGGPSGFLISYIGAVRFLFKARDIVQEGYDKFKHGSFRISTIDRWIVVVCGPQMVDEIRKAPDDTLSFEEAVNDIIQTQYTLGSEVSHDPYHVPAVRSQLTRNLGVLFPEIREEIITAFAARIPAPKDGWIEVPALETMMKIVAQVSNRIFVGLPLCRNSDFQDLNIQFAVDVVKSATVINIFPGFLKPLVGRYLTFTAASIKRGMDYLTPMIEERLRCFDEHPDDSSMKTNDMISWLIEVAKPEQRTPKSLTQMLLVVNFGAIHTSSMSFTHALFHIAALPHLVPILREEVETIVEKEGWTKAALGKMHKIDSFLRECQRFSGLEALTMTRKALRPFTFSNGTHLPAGATVAVASRALHHDETVYSNPDVFDAFRFSDLRDQDGDEVTKHQMVSTSLGYVPFGHGKHACPGRFFAANELKAMLAHLVTTYDIRLPDVYEGIRPQEQWFANNCVPNTGAKVAFRKRST